MKMSAPLLKVEGLTKQYTRGLFMTALSFSLSSRLTLDM